MKKRIGRELLFFFAATVYMWVYYGIFVLLDPQHPMEPYSNTMIIGSFFGLPLVMFIAVPIVNAMLAKRLLFTPRYIVIKTFLYIVASFLFLNLLFEVHMDISNKRAMKQLFPQGITKAFAENEANLQDSIKGTILIQDSSFIPPYSNEMNAAMGGKREPAIEVTYEYPGCGLDRGCEFRYVQEYDLETGEPTERSNSIHYAEEQWVEPLIQHDNWNDYTFFTVDHASQGFKINFRRYEPYFNIDAAIQHSEPHYIEGTISNVSPSAPEMIGKKMIIKGHPDEQVTIKINGDNFMVLPKE
ncbi:hypothetical protein [Bacillus sp. SG-1]|uniref:hypothetical protein n=1 Tax=Bacillus sp. SG-1 TaxID=161544 RepID=UPI0001543692|nr:hypothetical protein [Bacillus sp. SG-1]EDL65659.1 hypothetical protein BSG1_12331 [Bacillus sp. SG-1]